MPEVAAPLVTLLQFIIAREDRLFQVEEFNRHPFQAAKADVSEGSAMGWLNIVNRLLVRPGTARDDDHRVKWLAQSLRDSAMMQAGRVKAAPKNGDLRHGFDAAGFS